MNDIDYDNPHHNAYFYPVDSPAEAARKALNVIAKTPAIRDWLQANDPKALEQVDAALATFESYKK